MPCIVPASSPTTPPTGSNLSPTTQTNTPVLSSQYATLSPAVHELVNEICASHKDLQGREKYSFLITPAHENGLGRASIREYLANLKNAVANSVNAVSVVIKYDSRNMVSIEDAKAGLHLLSLVGRLSLLDKEETAIVDEEGILPFYLPR